MSFFHNTRKSKLQNMDRKSQAWLKRALSRIILESGCLHTIWAQCSCTVYFVNMKTNSSPSVSFQFLVIIMRTSRRKVCFSFDTNAILTFASFSNNQIIFPATILVYNLTFNKCDVALLQFPNAQADNNRSTNKALATHLWHKRTFFRAQSPWTVHGLRLSK